MNPSNRVQIEVDNPQSRFTRAVTIARINDSWFPNCMLMYLCLKSHCHTYVAVAKRLGTSTVVARTTFDDAKPSRLSAYTRSLAVLIMSIEMPSCYCTCSFGLNARPNMPKLHRFIWYGGPPPCSAPFLRLSFASDETRCALS